MIRRYEKSGKRWYYSTDDFVLYPSVTTILHATSPTPYGILKWYADLGWDGAEQRKNDAGEYGSCFHALAEWMMHKGELDVESALNYYLQFNKKLEYSTALLVRLQKDLAALIQFIVEHEVRSIDVEYRGVGCGYGGTVDLICEMKFNKKRVIAIVDYKTGSLHDDARLQLAAYARLVANTAGLEIEGLLNWQPSDWTKDTPTYKLTNQFSPTAQIEFDWQHNLFVTRHKAPTEHVEYVGVVKPGADLTPKRIPIVEYLQSLEVANV